VEKSLAMDKKDIVLEDLSNNGERLIPFISHNDEETIRHLASHLFFKKIIINDIDNIYTDKLEILDLGFGAGYASFVYASIDEVKSVKAIDVEDDLLKWAKINYYNKKIDYEITDAKAYLEKSKAFSYICTRHVLEHIDNGLNFIKEKDFTHRLCINVPYNEKPGNPYHVLTSITKKDFPKYKNVEFFYEDLDGNTYDKIPKNVFINSIICIASKDGLPRVGDYFKFPIKAPSIKDIYQLLSKNNYNFVENMLLAQSEKARQAELYKTLKNDHEELLGLYKTLKNDHEESMRKTVELSKKYNDIKKTLDNIYSSKKWKYATKMGEVKNKLMNNEQK
jgi:hypothetical protein